MPIVAGFQPYSLAQAAAATLKLVRSAHSSTLPAKKTVAVTVQLIGRAVPRWLPAAMAFPPQVAPGPRIRGLGSSRRDYAPQAAAPFRAAWYGAVAESSGAAAFLVTGFVLLINV